MTTVDLIPREVLFGNPTRTQPSISPDGRKLAYLAPLTNVLNVWVGSIDDSNYQPITQAVGSGIHIYSWAADSKHIVYLQDNDGNESLRLYSANLDTGERRDLTPFDNIRIRIIKVHKHFPHDLIIGMNKENPKAYDAYRLNLISGQLTIVAKNPGTFVEWIVDEQMKVRGAVSIRLDGGFDLLIRDTEQSNWYTVLTWNFDDSLFKGRATGPSDTLGFTLDGESLYLRDARFVNAERLVKLHITNRELTVLAEDSNYDVKDVMIHPDSREIQAVSFYKERLEWIILDDSIQTDFNIIRNIHRGTFSILSRDDADTLWLVGFIIDDSSIPFYLYDRRRQRAVFLFYSQSILNQYSLAQMEAISFTARDGLTLSGYLTLPVGNQKTNLPMVLRVHGGPWWVRDKWEYKSEVQWFANRGYACLQVNFRGSGGYGKKFLNAGNKEWGGKMQDDLIDAVHWAIQQGIANPKKIAIYGTSYGGYASLVGATFTPDVFCCAVSISGHANLVSVTRELPPSWAPLLVSWHQRIGNPNTEEEFLKARSPVFKADQIKIPLFIAQGANDPRVDHEAIEIIVDLIRDKGLVCEYLLFPDEGHAFVKPENRLNLYVKIEKFLADFLGGRYEN